MHGTPPPVASCTAFPNILATCPQRVCYTTVPGYAFTAQIIMNVTPAVTTTARRQVPMVLDAATGLGKAAGGGGVDGMDVDDGGGGGAGGGEGGEGDVADEVDEAPTKLLVSEVQLELRAALR